MLPLRAPIPLVTLFLSAACQLKGSTSSETTTGGSSESGDVVTTGSLEFPPVECHGYGGEEVCPSGKFCLFQASRCNLITCDSGDETGASGSTGSTPCWETSPTFTCLYIPSDCLSAPNQQQLANCILDHSLCPHDPYGESFFEDGKLNCPELLCQEGGNYQYGYCFVECSY